MSNIYLKNEIPAKSRGDDEQMDEDDKHMGEDGKLSCLSVKAMIAALSN